MASEASAKQVISLVPRPRPAFHRLQDEESLGTRLASNSYIPSGGGLKSKNFLGGGRGGGGGLHTGHWCQA